MHAMGRRRGSAHSGSGTAGWVECGHLLVCLQERGRAVATERAHSALAFGPIQGWVVHSVRNFQGTPHGRTCRSLAARCSQSCRARDGAPYYVLGFSRLRPRRILQPRTRRPVHLTPHNRRPPTSCKLWTCKQSTNLEERDACALVLFLCTTIMMPTGGAMELHKIRVFPREHYTPHVLARSPRDRSRAEVGCAA